MRNIHTYGMNKFFCTLVAISKAVLPDSSSDSSSSLAIMVAFGSAVGSPVDSGFGVEVPGT